MPVFVDTNRCASDDKAAGSRSVAIRAAEPQSAREFLHIGLVNNMPDGALQATERQFHSLLAAASDGISVRLSLYALPGIPRTGLSARHVDQHYASTESLRNAQLDGLIVTGREPIAARLQDEPYWNHFTEILEWAQDNTYSTVWSCLAAHAAILHMDGIRRVRSASKHFGVFDCERVSEHGIIAGTPTRFRLPHSRWNGVPEDELLASGYSILTRSQAVGVDTFVRQQNSLFIFFQGHPEYDPNALILEYRRDIGRYLHGDREAYPPMPQNYFDDEIANALLELQKKAMGRPHKELMTEAAAVLKKQKVSSGWHATATRIYRNWLEYIGARKRSHQGHGKAAAEAARDGGPESLSTASA